MYDLWKFILKPGFRSHFKLECSYVIFYGCGMYVSLIGRM